MKQCIFAVAATFCLLAAPGAFAQNHDRKPGRTPKERPTLEQMAQRRTARMTEELGLDEKQAKEVYAINLRQQKQMEAHRAQMAKERQAETEQMKSVLTAEQFAKWSQMQGPKPGAHRGKKGSGPCCDKQNKGCGKKEGRSCGDKTERPR